MPAKRTALVTGSARGIGRAIAERALAVDLVGADTCAWPATLPGDGATGGFSRPRPHRLVRPAHLIVRRNLESSSKPPSKKSLAILRSVASSLTPCMRHSATVTARVLLPSGR